jgi:hypothetical protein
MALYPTYLAAAVTDPDAASKASVPVHHHHLTPMALINGDQVALRPKIQSLLHLSASDQAFRNERLVLRILRKLGLRVADSSHQKSLLLVALALGSEGKIREGSRNRPLHRLRLRPMSLAIGGRLDLHESTANHVRTFIALTEAVY